MTAPLTGYGGVVRHSPPRDKRQYRPSQTELLYGVSKVPCRRTQTQAQTVHPHHPGASHSMISSPDLVRSEVWCHSTPPPPPYRPPYTPPYPPYTATFKPPRMPTLPYPAVDYPESTEPSMTSKDVTELESPVKSTQMHINTMYPYGYSSMYPYFMAFNNMYQVPQHFASQNEVPKCRVASAQHESSKWTENKIPMIEKQSSEQQISPKSIELTNRVPYPKIGNINKPEWEFDKLQSTPSSIPQSQLRPSPSSTIPQWLDTIPSIKNKGSMDKSMDRKTGSLSSPPLNAVGRAVHNVCLGTQARLYPSAPQQYMFRGQHKNDFVNSRSKTVTNWYMPPSYNTLQYYQRINMANHHAHGLNRELSNESEDEDFSIQMALGPLDKTAQKRQTEGSVKPCVTQHERKYAYCDYVTSETPMPPLIPLNHSRPVSNESTGSNRVPTSGSELDENEAGEVTDVTKINANNMFDIPELYIKRPEVLCNTKNSVDARYKSRTSQQQEPEFLRILNEVHSCGKAIDNLLLKFESRHLTDEVLQSVEKYANSMRTLWFNYNRKVDSKNSVVGVFEFNTDFIKNFLRLLKEYKSELMCHYLETDHKKEVPSKRKRGLSHNQHLSVFLPNFSASSWKLYNISEHKKYGEELAFDKCSKINKSPPMKRKKHLHELENKQHLSGAVTENDLNSSDEKTRGLLPNLVKMKRNTYSLTQDGFTGSDKDQIEIGSNNADEALVKPEAGGGVDSQALLEAGINKETQLKSGCSYIMEQFSLMDKQHSGPMTKQMLQELADESGVSVKTIKRLYGAHVVKNMCSKRLELAATIQNSSLGCLEMK